MATYTYSFDDLFGNEGTGSLNTNAFTTGTHTFTFNSHSRSSTFTMEVKGVGFPDNGASPLLAGVYASSDLTTGGSISGSMVTSSYNSGFVIPVGENKSFTWKPDVAVNSGSIYMRATGGVFLQIDV